MRADDVVWALNLVGQLWPYFADPKHSTPERNHAMGGLFERFQGDCKQVEAILNDAWTSHDSGYPPIAKIRARLENASASRIKRPSEMPVDERREILADRIATVARMYGLSALLHDHPVSNLNARSWCRLAKSMGLDVVSIVSKAINRPAGEVHSELMRLARAG